MTYPLAAPRVIECARQILALKPLLLDTETTGIGSDALIIEIGIVDSQGQSVYSALVNPGIPIPAESSAVNHITDDMVRDQPSWEERWREVEPILRNRAIGMYNAEFDTRMLRQSTQSAGMNFNINSDQTFCMMNLFSAYWGEPKAIRSTELKSHKLEFAGKECGLSLPNSHRAVDDAKLTAALLRHIASRSY